MAQNADTGGQIADQLETGIGNAIKAHDVKAAVEILEALAAVDLDRATKVYEVLQVALVIGASPNESLKAP